MSLLAGLCTLMGPGCHADLEDETQATRVVEGMKNHMMHLGDQEPRRRPVLPASEVERVERRDGGLMAVRGKPARTSTVHPARVVLPEAAQQPFLLEDEGSGLSLEVTLEGVGPAKAEVVDGYVVYPDVNADGADVVHRFTAEGTEDYVRFERAPAAPEVRYRLGLGNTVAGLRLVGDTLEVLDASGAPRLRMTPPYVVGADGRITPAGLSVEGCAVDTDPAAPWGRSVKAPGARQCQVRVAWNGSDVAYPAVLDPAWITTGSLSVARSELTATRLPDGRILAAGGQLPAYDTTGRSELYDPATGTWASTGWMFVSRRQHTATLLNSGKVLAVGGYSGGGGLNGSTELYDPATGTWTRTGDLYKARGAHSATLLTDGRVLILGGWTSY
ncbi:MAG TPA: kelch repeat-containing protein, partial [Archangium sp.]|nr:kelch repeat-containing protein [Archangium sp.]